MADIAKRDEQRIPAIQAVSSVDGKTPTDAHINPTTHELLVQASINENVPTSALKNNPAITLTYTSGLLTKITKTISGTDYDKTLSYDGDNNLTDLSAWS